MSHPYVAPGFEPVADAFRTFVAEPHGPTGAAFAAYHEGRLVVDLWHGWRDRARAVPWTADTLAITMSAAKGPAALVIHLLAERGLLDLDEPVARYWPEFSAEGKGGVLIRHVLTHRAGVPYLRDEVLSLEPDHDAWARELERAPLRSEPGAVCRYHMITHGYLLGELVRRVTGNTLGTVLRRDICEPLHADFFIGLRPEEEGRVAEVIEKPEAGLFELSRAAQPGDLLFPIRQMDARFNSSAFRRAEIPSSNGCGTAAGLARLYAALSMGGTLDGIRIVAPETIRRAAALASDAIEGGSGLRWRLGLGFFKSSEYCRLGPSDGAFGHPGYGGNLAMADPDRRVAIAMVRNEPPTSNPFEHANAMVDAVYECLDNR